jgi:threonine/homoserine efflux transporter RhtA
MALFNMGAILAVLVGVWSANRVARRDVRVTVAQGLVVMAGAVSVFGMSLAVVSLDSPPLVPLGLGVIGLSVAMGTYGARLFRTRS